MLTIPSFLLFFSFFLSLFVIAALVIFFLYIGMYFDHPRTFSYLSYKTVDLPVSTYLDT